MQVDHFCCCLLEDCLPKTSKSYNNINDHDMQACLPLQVFQIVHAACVAWLVSTPHRGCCSADMLAVFMVTSQVVKDMVLSNQNRIPGCSGSHLGHCKAGIMNIHKHASLWEDACWPGYIKLATGNDILIVFICCLLHLVAVLQAGVGCCANRHSM